MSRTAEIQREIVYIIYVRNVWICRKYLISRTPKIQREIVYIIYVRNGWICRKIDCPILRKFNGKLYTLYVRNVWICREIEYPELRKFKGKFCTIFMYDMSRFAEKLNVQNCINSTENCVHYICTKCLDLQKNWLSRTA